MVGPLIRTYSLENRGNPGLACDEDGLALGPVILAKAFRDTAGHRRYLSRPPEDMARLFRLAYGPVPDRVMERWCRGLARVVQLLASGEDARARLHAVLLGFPEIAPDGMAKLARAAGLRKYGDAWEDEPRVPAGNPDGGQWTTDGGDAETADAGITPAAYRTSDDIQAMKERFVDAHLADAQKAADKLGVPVENILGLSALESTWGEGRFAAQGNNFFGIHYPAPFATGYMMALDAPIKVATFASYADSINSFVAISGSIIQGINDPEVFAASLQNSGKFGIDSKTGMKVPDYVGNVANTIKGLRSIIARHGV